MRANWNTPAGQALVKLAEVLAADHPGLQFRIKVFGSGILQLFHDPSHLSADVDVEVLIQLTDHDDGQMHFEDHQRVVDAVERHYLGRGQAAFYIEVPDAVIFKPGRDWQQRCRHEKIGPVTYLLPDVMDILIGKLQRRDADDFLRKDLASFRKIMPDEALLIRELQIVEPGRYFPRKTIFHRNIELLWHPLYKRTIDVKSEILQVMHSDLVAQGHSPHHPLLIGIEEAMSA